MTISDLRCDHCGTVLTGLAIDGAPAAGTGRRGVRFRYHPGTPALGDDSGLLCESCWQAVADELGERRGDVCARCGCSLAGAPALHVSEVSDVASRWQLCGDHALEWLNRLRTVDPKLDPETFALPPPPPPPSGPEPPEEWVEVRLRR